MNNRFCEEAQRLVLKSPQVENLGKFLQMTKQIKLGNRTAAFQACAAVESAFQANIEEVAGRRIIGKDGCFSYLAKTRPCRWKRTCSVSAADRMWD